MAFTVKSSGFLRQLATYLREAPKYVQREAARDIAARIERRIDNQFVTGRDPYGKKWPNPKDGHRPSMVRTSRLREGYTVRVVPGGVGLSIEISNSQVYAVFLQRGTSRMEPRMQVPGTIIPEAWQDDFDRAYKAALDKWYARGPK